MNDKTTEKTKTYERSRGIPLILSLAVFTFSAVFSVMLLRGTVADKLAKGELQRQVSLEKAGEASVIRNAAERLQDMILVTLSEDGTTDRCIRLETDEEGRFSATCGTGFPDFLKEPLTALVESKANGEVSFQRTFRLTGDGEPLSGRSGPKEGVIDAELTLDENAPGYPFSIKLTEQSTGITVYLNFQSSSLSYENAIHTEDIYWYESRMSLLKEKP